MTESKPALTAEEWKVGLVVFKPKQQYDEGVGFEFYTNPSWVAYGKADFLWVYNGSWAVMLQDETRHKIAAVALCGQEFGFTREDVALLREGLAYEQADYLPETIPLFNSLAARIQALLPPDDAS